MTSRIPARRDGVDVVLINPPYKTPSVRTGIYYTSFPLGLGYLAAVLKAEDFSVAAIDCSVEFNSIYDTLESIVKLNPRIVGISVTSLGLRFAYLLSRSLRDRIPSVTIVVGGPHVTVDPSIVSELNADFGFRGEAEEGFPELCRHVLRGDMLPDAHGIVFNGDEVNIKPPSIINDIDGLPFPDRTVFDEDKYRFQSSITSRGCPFECCYCGMAGTRFRQRSLDNVVEEVKSLLSRGFSSIDFADDVFTLDSRYVHELCGRMTEEGLSFRWSCTTRADLVDFDLLKTMNSAGCTHISFGVESGVEHIRYSLGKKIPNDKIVEAFDDCRKLGIKTRAYAMLGVPGETVHDMHETIKFINHLNPDNVLYTATIVFPGTRLMDYCIRNSLLSPDAWRRYMQGISPRPLYTPKDIPLKKLGVVIDEAYNSFYLRPEFIATRFKEAKSLGDVVKASGLAVAWVSEKLFRSGGYV